MNPRLHDALDGHDAARALTTAERAELAEAVSQIDAVLRAVPSDPLPDLAPAVLERIRHGAQRGPARLDAPRATAPEPRRRVADWLWRPRTVTVTWRPAHALAAAAMLLAAVAVGDAWRPGAATVADASSPRVFTQFVLEAPGARDVAVAGDFSGWQPVHHMKRSGAGVWTVVVSLDPGVHAYAFVVDGERWVPDPAAPAVEDGFGGVNSRVTVMPPEGARS
ncbi:MAG TPA: glycogen-binding domain-containing protein [Gemmatimonadales bacterium]